MAEDHDLGSHPERRLSESRLQTDLRELADDRFEGRNGGSEGERKAALFLADRFRELGLEPGADDGSFLQEFSFLPRMPLPGQTSLKSQNVIAVLRGSGTAPDHRPVVIGAHYDGQGRIGQADPGRDPSELAREGDEIWNAADDNASSTAVLLDVARRFRLGELEAARDIVFVAFGAEEHGMPGSFHFVASDDFEAIAMLNLEQLGRWQGEELMTAGFATSPAWQEAVTRANERENRATVLALDQPEADTDHYPFFLVGVPAMTAGFPDGPQTHTAADEADDLSYEDLAWRSRYIAVLLEEIVNLDSPPVFASDLSRELPFVAVKASAEEIADAGLSESGMALKIVAMIDAGGDQGRIELGDLIMEIGGEKVEPSDEWNLHSQARELADGTCLQLKMARGESRFEVCL